MEEDRPNVVKERQQENTNRKLYRNLKKLESEFKKTNMAWAEINVEVENRENRKRITEV